MNKILIMLLLPIFYVSLVHGEQKVQCRISGTIGAVHHNICDVLNAFAKRTKANISVKDNKGPLRLLLYGAPGNGKTFLAKKIAQETDSEFLVLDAPSIVNEYQGSGAQVIKQTVNKAIDLTKQGKKVVVFIDEIDAIVSKDFSKNQQECTNAMQTLWCELSRHENNQNLLFIFATNNFEKLHAAFHSRFPESQMVELTNPNEAQRYELIQCYFILHQLPLFNDYELEILWSSYDPEVQRVYAFAPQEIKTSLKKIEAEFIELSNMTAIASDKITEVCTQKREAIKKSLAALKAKIEEVKRMIWIHSRGGKRGIMEETKEYFDLIDNYIAIAQKSLNFCYLCADHLTELAQMTEDFSIRDITYFVIQLHQKACIPENEALRINFEMAKTIASKINISKQKNAEELTEAERQKVKDLQTKLDVINTQIRNTCFGEPEKRWVLGFSFILNLELFSTLNAKACATKIKEEYGYDRISKQLESCLKNKRLSDK